MSRRAIKPTLPSFESSLLYFFFCTTNTQHSYLPPAVIPG
jgi:hypothetical protein